MRSLAGSDLSMRMCAVMLPKTGFGQLTTRLRADPCRRPDRLAAPTRAPVYVPTTRPVLLSTKRSALTDREMIA